MTVPEAALDQHYGSKSWKNQVRTAWQRYHVQSEAETRTVQRCSDAALRFGVTSPDPRHHPGTGSAVNDVRHLTPEMGN